MRRAAGSCLCATAAWAALAAHPRDAFAQDGGGDAQASIDVTVHGARSEEADATMGRREIREMPGVLGDPYRAVEIQPGVTPAASGMPYWFVRGAPPGNVGYFLDGIRVPFLFHVGAGPSVIPPSVVSRVDLHLGSYPASLGRLAGAVVDARTAPPRAEWHGEGVFRTIDGGGTIEGPIGEGGTTVLAGGHLAFGAALFSALVPSVGVGWADYQIRVSRPDGGNGRWTALGFGSWDYLARVVDGVDDVLLDGDFHRLDLRYERSTTNDEATTLGVTLGLDRSRGTGVRSATDHAIGARASVARRVSPKVVARAGSDAWLDAYDIQPGGEPCSEEGCPPGVEPATERELEETFRVLFPSRVDLAIGGWADLVIALDERSSLTPGLRIDHYTSLGETAVGVDPRLSGRFAVGDRVRLLPAVGLASQPPGFAPLPALVIGGLPGGLQRALQTSFGAEVDLFPIELETTLFRHAIFGLTDAIGGDRGSRFGRERFLSRSIGDTYGLELSARGALRRDVFFYGAYTLSRSTRTKGRSTLPSAYDRTHVLHFALLFDLGKSWRAGFRHVLYTGFPADETGPGHTPSEDPPRTRPFYRLDARLSKRWRLGRTGYVGLVFDMQNVTLAKEVFDVACDEDRCEPRTIGPIAIPGLALEGGF